MTLVLRVDAPPDASVRAPETDARDELQKVGAR
jgi:hypothetical protein